MKSQIKTWRFLLLPPAEHSNTWRACSLCTDRLPFPVILSLLALSKAQPSQVIELNNPIFYRDPINNAESKRDVMWGKYLKVFGYIG